MNTRPMTGAVARPIVLVTGAAGNLGRSVAGALAGDYRIVGLDRKAKDGAPDLEFPILEVDFTAMRRWRWRCEAFATATARASPAL